MVDPSTVMRRTTSSVRIATIGAAFSANKGAASMLQAIVDNVPDYVGASEIDVLTTYPEADARENPNRDVAIVPCRPLRLLVPMLPVALLVAVLRTFGFRGEWLCRTRALRALMRADVVVDLAGISFADDRGLPILGYNILMTGVPLLLGRPVVKCSQALGPFHTEPNRTAARAVLSRVETVLARGRQTEAHLHELGLDNVLLAADLAFTMHVPEEVRTRVATSLRADRADGNLVSVMPSAVVESYCRDVGVDYLDVMARFVDRLSDRKFHVVLAAHSARPGRRKSRMNDLPVIRDIYSRLDRDSNCSLLDASMTPAELRALIETSDALVTSRFHAMISALAASTPVLVVGWSHKYEEVLEEFDLEEWAVGYDGLTVDLIEECFASLVARSEDVRETIEQNRPEVVRSAKHNFEVIARTIEGAV